MKEILVIGGSNSPVSINQCIAKEMSSHPRVDYFDTRTINDTGYNKGIEKNEGFPQDIIALYDKIHQYKKLIIVTPEYNRYFSSFFKSILDWFSRYERYYFQDVEIYLVAVTRGRRGGSSVREALKFMLSFSGANLIGDEGISQYDESNDYSKEIEAIINNFK